MEALVQLAEKGDQHAITAVAARLEDTCVDAKRAAVYALMQIAEKGNRHAISAVAARIEDVDKQVRCAAVAALMQLAEKGDQHTITAVAGCLADEAWSLSGGSPRAEMTSVRTRPRYITVYYVVYSSTHMTDEAPTPHSGISSIM